MLLADVVVDTTVWALDRCLTYAVPPVLAPRIRVGSVVRVPLRGREVRGWVVALREGEASEGTLDVAALSGRGPVLDDALIAMARAMAERTVHPLASYLKLFTPPRLGRPPKEPLPSPSPPAQQAVCGGGTVGTPQVALIRLGVVEDPVERYAALVQAALGEGRGAIVVAPEVREGSRVLAGLAERFPDEAAVVHSGLDPAERSRALWSVAAGERRLVLGGRAAVFAPPFPLGVIVVHAEHDRSLKEQRAPYYDTRDAGLERACATGASLVLASATPSLRSLAGAERRGWRREVPDRPAERAVWPAVELLEPGKAGTVMPRRAIAAIIEARRRGERTLVLLPRAQATRAGPGPEQVARFVERVVPGARVRRADRPGLGPQAGALVAALDADVVVATEAALADVERPRISTAVALGVDAMLLRPAGRAVEEAFEALWTLGSLVAGAPASSLRGRPRHDAVDPGGGVGRAAGEGADLGSGPARSPGTSTSVGRGAAAPPGTSARSGRLLLETATPEHHVVQALTRGDYHYFASRELAARRETGSPPFRRLVRVSSPAQPDDDVMAALAALPGTVVLGPVPVEGRSGGSAGRAGGGAMEVRLKVEELETVVAPLRRLVSASRQRLLVEIDARDW